MIWAKSFLIIFKEFIILLIKKIYTFMIPFIEAVNAMNPQRCAAFNMFLMILVGSIGGHRYDWHVEIKHKFHTAQIYH